MARQCSTKRNHRSRNAKARPRVVGLGTSAGAFLAFGLTPLATAPAANADELDLILDPILNSLSSIEPTLGTDLSGLASSFNPTFATDAATAAGSATGLADVSNGVLASDPPASFSSLVSAFETGFYQPLLTAGENFINNPANAPLLNAINQPFVELFGRDLIGNGITGDTANTSIFGSSGDFGNLSDGGFLFGDGANGAAGTADVDGGSGGAGGDAELFGNGGAGGAGVDGGAGGAGGAGGSFVGIGGAGGAGGTGVDGGVGGAGGAGGDAPGLFGVGGTGGDGGDGGIGGNGGDGGSGTGLFGSGGDGGNGGNGSDGGSLSVLPALGGAGGNGGLLGSHGAVGDYGTLAGVSSGATSPAQTASTDELDLPLSTTGTWITNSDGQVVILHGFDEVYKVAPFEPSAGGFGADDAAFLAANGFNAVRLGIIWAAVEPEPGVFNEAYLASIAQTVQILGNHGIVTILDMHQDSYSSVFAGEGAPEWATQTGGLPNPDFGFPANYVLNPAENYAWDAFWSNAEAPDGVGLENSYAQMWEYVANYFNGNPDVAGFEIMNEPWPGSPWLQSFFGSPFFDTQELTPFYNQVDSAIRAVDPTTPVFFEPNQLFNDGAPTNLGTVNDPNTVFAFHDYCPVSSFLNGMLCPLWDDISMGKASAYAGSHDIPALITEFGSANGSTAIADTMSAADQYQYGWTEWAYNGVPSITGTSPAAALVYNPNLPPVGDNVDTARLAVSAEPYPQVVSGTPDPWSFDDGTFQFSYSTERVDGLGSFAAGSQTTVSVPAVEYPNGYQVSVTGGQVVSAPNAPELVIASDAGASTVSVVVTPSTSS